jgi:hypothetical protein
VTEPTLPPRSTRAARGLAFFLAGVLAGVLGVFAAERVNSRGLPPRRIEATVFLPLVDNDDHPFPEDAWRDVLGLFADKFGGATLGPSLEGCWRDDAGRLRREPVRPVVVSFDPEHLARFRQVLDAAGSRLGQEAVYVRFEEPHVELRRVPDRPPKSEH